MSDEERLTLSCFMILAPSQGHDDLSARLTKRPPDLSSDERAVKLNLSVPASAFERPSFEANLTIEEGHLREPEPIEIEVVSDDEDNEERS